ncbi:hypothetical protein PHLCEN_2v12385 [Hermanssonia centrifuga]|uniref:Uncharacterized protein n=1 Tax=Hermanssonia centrifuga TaxID=98765 RepID=A0A2R6NH73_9APHY|nr:hypothetical protein PHLCEN_2v12385 [Hermanssonia centrifuga]
MTEPRIAFKAGRAFRRGGSNFVDPSSTKGAVILQNGEDGLLHFVWKNRVTQENEEDADTSRDDEFVGNVNRLLADPDSIPIWYAPGYNPSNAQAGPSSGDAPSSQPPAGPSSIPAASSEQLTQLQEIMGSVTEQAGRPEYLLQDILTPANLTPLFISHPELVPTLFPFLPSDLPTPPSAEALQQIISSPQFRSAVRNIDVALSTGALHGFVRALGLPEEAGTGFDAFLRAIQDQARERGDGMDTD